MLGAGLMLAHQVAGKAVRDSFFLSNHSVTDLPRVVIASAAVTVVFVLLFARALGRFGPRRLVPAGFLLSAAAHLVEYLLAPGSPALWSVLIYFHIVALGAILLSAFWSQMAESFDPRAAKQAFGRITGAGTLGGITGGLLAERVAALFSPMGVLLLLATFHLLCAVVLSATRRAAGSAPEIEGADLVSPIELFRRAPYLLRIAILVLVGTGSAAILDYLFKAGAGLAFGKGAPLLRFFAVFYTSTQVLTFFAQTSLAQRSLRSLGIGRTISALPLGVAASAMGALFVPAFPVFALGRSVEFVLRGSLFRSGYELLYTPIPAAQKRAAKTLIDVGCDRAGDALGSGLIQLMLWFGASFITSEFLGLALALAAMGVWAALRLDREYAGLVQQRLVDRAVELDIPGMQDSTTLSALATVSSRRTVPRAPQAPPQRPLTESVRMTTDATLDMIRELRSGDARRVLVAIKGMHRPGPIIAAQLIRLLAWDEVSNQVRETLLFDPKPITGLLTDYLTSEKDAQFGVRRRIPRILSHCGTQLAVHGLLAGLKDSRFEVRFQCSRALDALLQRNPELHAPPAEVFAVVESELQVARPLWESRRLIDQRESSDAYAFFDEHLRERANQSLEHVFSLFAAVLPREPVKIAFRALHTDDRVLRSLAVEYLEGVLPQQVRERLWPIIEPGQAAGGQRPHKEVLNDLLQSHESLLLRLDRSAIEQ
jgi:hypothetical protein